MFFRQVVTAWQRLSVNVCSTFSPQGQTIEMSLDHPLFSPKDANWAGDSTSLILLIVD